MELQKVNVIIVTQCFETLNQFLDTQLAKLNGKCVRIDQESFEMDRLHLGLILNLSSRSLHNGFKMSLNSLFN